MKPRPFDTIIYGGLTAGTLDILDAFIVSGLRGVSPERVLRYIASGVMGSSAGQSGIEVPALGLALHFVIAAGRSSDLLGRESETLNPGTPPDHLRNGVWPRRLGLHAGTSLVPLSLVRGGAGSPPLLMLLNQLGIHALGVGLPIALFASRSAQSDDASEAQRLGARTLQDLRVSLW